MRIAGTLSDKGVYHVLNRGHGRAEVFHKPEDFAAFLKLIVAAKKRYPVKVIAYCLMSDHFHLLIQADRREDLNTWMQWLTTRHVRCYCRRYGTNGRIWQGRFKSFLVQRGSHLLTAMRYVEGNPVRVGTVPSARQWPWSSHWENLGAGTARAVPVVDEGLVKLPPDWAARVDRPLTGGELDRIKESIHRLVPFAEPVPEAGFA